MDHNQTELEFERVRLEQTKALAEELLVQARQRNEETKSAIITAKQDLWENTSHSIANLWSSEEFEALAELNQYADPVSAKVADFEAIENKIAQLERIIRSPYFARIDFKFSGEDTFEKIYIGRSSLKREKSREFYVYDWRSPIASVFYRFMLGQVYYDAPGGRITGEVNLKRQYEIEDSKLEYFFDADVQIIDEFLRKMLSQNASPKMKAIVETIQREQDIVIRDMESDLMMVQGVAGSGKTSIALHRVAYLMYQGLSAKLSVNNILVISPNTLFEQYISDVLPELGEDNVVSVVFDDIMAKTLQRRHIQGRNDFLEILLCSPDYRNTIKNSIDFKTSGQFQKILDRLIADIPYRRLAYRDVYYNGERLISKEKIREKVLAGGKETPIGVRIKLIRDYVWDLIRESHRRNGKKSQKLPNREEALEFMELDLFTVYQGMFCERTYFCSLTEDIRLPSDLDEIISYTRDNLNSNRLYYDDAIALTYLSLKTNGNRHYRNIKQVVIDEAQDYYPLQFEVFRLLFPQSRFTVLGDMNQTLDKEADPSMYDQIKTILNRKKASLAMMEKSFRCTNEILNYSARFLERKTEIKSFNRSGEQPGIYPAENTWLLAGKIISEVLQCLKQGYESVGLICKTEKNVRHLYSMLKDSLNVHLAPKDGTASLQGVLLIPVYMSKGLEFDAVLICDADEQNYYSADDKKLLYIACTRALHRLNLFCCGAPSPLLDPVQGIHSLLTDKTN